MRNFLNSALWDISHHKGYWITGDHRLKRMPGSHPVWFLASRKSSFKVRSSCLCIMMLCVLPQRTTEKSLIQPSSWSFVRYLKTANSNLLSLLFSRLSKSSSLSSCNQEVDRNPCFPWALNLIVGGKSQQQKFQPGAKRVFYQNCHVVTKLSFLLVIIIP